MQSPEYLKACNAYLKDAIAVLTHLNTYTVRPALEMLNRPRTGAACSPKRICDAGWDLRDYAEEENEVDGWPDRIGYGLIRIGETCARNAYPMDDRTLELMHDIFGEMVLIKRELRIED